MPAPTAPRGVTAATPCVARWLIATVISVGHGSCWSRCARSIFAATDRFAVASMIRSYWPRSDSLKMSDRDDVGDRSR